jgi:hypothetical protein
VEYSCLIFELKIAQDVGTMAQNLATSLGGQVLKM